MGLHAVLSEDCGIISSRQQQYILIACAIMSNPKMPFFDEEISALDNTTQNMVCKTFESMDSARFRFVIANRDRIIALYKRHVVEQETYEELVKMICSICNTLKLEVYT